MGRNSSGVRGGSGSTASSNGSREIIKDLSGFDERETRTVKWLTNTDEVPNLKGNMESEVVYAMRGTVYHSNNGKTAADVIEDIKNGKIDIVRTSYNNNVPIEISVKGAVTKLNKKLYNGIPSGKAEGVITMKVNGRVVRKEKRKFDFY